VVERSTVEPELPAGPVADGPGGDASDRNTGPPRENVVGPSLVMAPYVTNASAKTVIATTGMVIHFAVRTWIHRAQAARRAFNRPRNSPRPLRAFTISFLSDRLRSRAKPSEGAMLDDPRTHLILLTCLGGPPETPPDSVVQRPGAPWPDRRRNEATSANEAVPDRKDQGGRHTDGHDRSILYGVLRLDYAVF
jgi:hypothetical protein